MTEQVMEEPQAICQQQDYRRPGARCTRPATVFEEHWSGNPEWTSAYCDEHTRVHEHSDVLNHWNLALSLALEWLEEARGRELEGLSRRVEALVEECRTKQREAEVRYDEAHQFASRAMVEAEA